ncbi:unnamed protein product [Nesidiocoris tenuis]|uniref:GPN-loop GTPase 2 n=1 Tax=Nesidiocoris tenuis TaxID=355587 RepID=A0A6H5H5G3_9HEMI|nr:unnamed protein product [Nesidiocoris tenuis]
MGNFFLKTAKKLHEHFPIFLSSSTEEFEWSTPKRKGCKQKIPILESDEEAGNNTGTLVRYDDIDHTLVPERDLDATLKDDRTLVRGNNNSLAENLGTMVINSDSEDESTMKTEVPQLRGIATAHVYPGFRNGAGNRRTEAALPDETATYHGRYGSKAEKTAELLMNEQVYLKELMVESVFVHNGSTVVEDHWEILHKELNDPDIEAERSLCQEKIPFNTDGKNKPAKMPASFGQLVMGPPGSGKSTYCKEIAEFLKSLGREVVIVNIDPANDELIYEAAVDVSDLITVEDVMTHKNLGPNGGLIYSIEYLEKNFIWFHESLSKFKGKGQIEKVK